MFVLKVGHEDTGSLSASDVEERKIRMLCKKNNAKGKLKTTGVFPPSALTLRYQLTIEQ